jgi:hypothetical protein
MTVRPALDPACSRSPTSPEIATIIDARPRDLGDLTVGRVLPAAARRMVGSFIFFDPMGPFDLPAGRGIDVRPHPHIALKAGRLPKVLGDDEEFIPLPE